MNANPPDITDTSLYIHVENGGVTFSKNEYGYLILKSDFYIDGNLKNCGITTETMLVGFDKKDADALIHFLYNNFIK